MMIMMMMGNRKVKVRVFCWARKRSGKTMANPKKMFWNKDLVTEISLHLPLPSLFRCRAVCKLWRDVIDSPFFRKQHTLTHTRREEEEDEKVYLQLHYDYSKVKVSIKVVIEKGRSLNLNLRGFPSLNVMQRGSIGRFSAPVNGLICFNHSLRPLFKPILIANPFLAQFKILPFSPNPCELGLREVAIGCGSDGEGEAYKVVEMANCREHRRLHAHLYYPRTDSWRELVGGVLDQQMCILTCINSSRSNGRFAHWYAWTPPGNVILTLDMRSEAFRTTGMGEPLCDEYGIVAKDDRFVLVILPEMSDELVRIYESSICEEDGIRKLRWKHVVNLEQPMSLPSPTHLPLWRRDRVIVKILWSRGSLIGIDGGAKSGVKCVVYDCSARRIVGCFKLPFSSEFFDYDGTFISP